MDSELKKNEEVSIIKTFWALFLMLGVQIVGRSLFWINMVPLSYLFWPYENFKAIEMGLILTIASITTAFSGMVLGKVVDKYSRKKILVISSIIIGITRICIAFAKEGRGYETWIYFLVFMTIASIFIGGNRPAQVSISNDALRKDQRAQFFGILALIWAVSQFSGFVLSSYVFQVNLWREYLWITGGLTILVSFIYWATGKEPKRGFQEDELHELLKNDSIVYDFQINKELMKKTMLSKTNVAALVEGTFSCVLLGVFYALILPYTQLAPHFISSFVISIMLVTFGIIGTIIGLILAKLSDKYAAIKPIRRIKFIIFSLSGLILIFSLFFFIELPILFPWQGNDISLIFNSPSMWLFGIGIVAAFSISGMYDVNQPPLLQNINLPEAQGQIIAWNQFLETIGSGLGPLICGILLVATNQNFQLTALWTLLFGVPGILFWTLSLKWYPQDRKLIKDILEKRAEILKSRK
ncbi:MAG: MFS transporter [Candidatus Helarchaeota archaeon]